MLERIKKVSVLNTSTETRLEIPEGENLLHSVIKHLLSRKIKQFLESYTSSAKIQYTREQRVILEDLKFYISIYNDAWIQDNLKHCPEYSELYEYSPDYINQLLHFELEINDINLIIKLNCSTKEHITTFNQLTYSISSTTSADSISGDIDVSS